jgi:2-amino-4-hydroxy-6-hydroxymethyldihydropteridine diphosphokinase
LQAHPLIVVQAVSPWWGNRAVGGPAGQGDFLNGAAIIETSLGPHAVLQVLRRLEFLAGRLRHVVNGPRTLDLDLILADNQAVVGSSVLTMPHPRLIERDFVLKPLADIAAAWLIPGTNACAAYPAGAAGWRMLTVSEAWKSLATQ